MSFPVAGARWLEPYAVLNTYDEGRELPGFFEVDRNDYDIGLLLQGGTSIRVSPERWPMHPVVRVGIGFAKYGDKTEFTGVMGGVGLHVPILSLLWNILSGGFAVTADFWSAEERTSAVAHAGIYLRFG